MIDLSFHFRESTEEEKKLIFDSLRDVQDFSNIRCFTGKRWNNSGIVAVALKGNVCTILNVIMQNGISTDFSDIYYFYEHLIYHLFNFAKRIEWKTADTNLQHEFLNVIAYFDRKVVGERRVRTVYKAGVINETDDIFYYVEKHKKVFIRRLNKPRKEKPLSLSRSETGLPVDISDVQSWSTPELGRMEYIVLKKDKEEYCLFPSENEVRKEGINEMERIWNFFCTDDEDTSFTKEEIASVREWMNIQLSDKNSTLSQCFAQRRAENEKHYKDLCSRIQENTARQNENLMQFKAKQ